MSTAQIERHDDAANDAVATATATDNTTAAAAVWSQITALGPLLLAIYIPTLVALVALVIVHLVTDIPIRYFMIDPVTEFAAPMYLGFFSNLGVLQWCSTAAVCLFGGWLLFKNGQQREAALFLLCSGIVTALLMFDDLFLLHEEVLPDHFFVPQMVVFAAYGTLIIGYFWRFRKMILSTEYTVLLMALGFFALSVFVDLFVTPEEFYIVAGFLGRHLIEDGLKLFGIVSWATYLIRVSLQRLAPCVRPAWQCERT